MRAPKDKNGVPMGPGQKVTSPTGHTATLVFANCALRFCIAGIQNLDKNGSLVFSDRWKPADFEVLV